MPDFIQQVTANSYACAQLITSCIMTVIGIIISVLMIKNKSIPETLIPGIVVTPSLIGMLGAWTTLSSIANLHVMEPDPGIIVNAIFSAITNRGVLFHTSLLPAICLIPGFVVLGLRSSAKNYGSSGIYVLFLAPLVTAAVIAHVVMHESSIWLLRILAYGLFGMCLFFSTLARKHGYTLAAAIILVLLVTTGEISATSLVLFNFFRAITHPGVVSPDVITAFQREIQAACLWSCAAIGCTLLIAAYAFINVSKSPSRRALFAVLWLVSVPFILFLGNPISTIKRIIEPRFYNIESLDLPKGE